MKRYNCTTSDKRGAFGLCMEEHQEGMFVPFSEVEPLKQRVHQLLEERNSTGLAIDNAIRDGIVPDTHPLKSRLEMLAKHHERERELTAQLEAANRKCAVMAELLLESHEVMRRIIPPLPQDFANRSDLLDRIEGALTGELLDHVAGAGKMVPDGWQLVPVEPTPEMVEAYFAGKMEAQSCTHQLRARERVARDYKAMLAAAPKPQGGAPCDTGLPSSKSD